MGDGYDAMMSLTALVEHWGYAAVFAIVVLGNIGLPVPEESMLTLAGYLVWRGELRGPMVIAVGGASAAMGDNIGYWFGRRTGASATHRYGRHPGITAAQSAQGEE